MTEQHLQPLGAAGASQAIDAALNALGAAVGIPRNGRSAADIIRDALNEAGYYIASYPPTRAAAADTEPPAAAVTPALLATPPDGREVVAVAKAITLASWEEVGVEEREGYSPEHYAAWNWPDDAGVAAAAIVALDKVRANG